MNWFTRSLIATSSVARKKELFEQDGGCPHVEKDVSLASVIRREMDSFGPVSSHVCCSACDTQVEEAEDNRTHICHDCKLVKKKKEGFFWRWYDFYAAQGDQALFICNDCRKLPKHCERARQDQEDYDAESGRDQSFDA